MIKVQVLTTCAHCSGQAYLPIGEFTDHMGRSYMRHSPCPMCDGSGQRTAWIPIETFARLLAQAACQHVHTSHNGGFHFSGGDVWDDLIEVCDDCGANLDRQTLGDFIDDPE